MSFCGVSGPHRREIFTTYLHKSSRLFMGTINITITIFFFVNLINPIVKRYVKRLKRASSTSYLYSNVLKPIYFESWMPHFFVRSMQWSRGKKQAWPSTFFILRTTHYYFMRWLDILCFVIRLGIGYRLYRLLRYDINIALIDIINCRFLNNRLYRYVMVE
jgi:hypothetical protein